MGTQVPREDAGESFLEGKLLIALPGMPDPRFEKSVIFICAHSGEGAMGLIINKPVEGLSFREMMEKLNIGEFVRLRVDDEILSAQIRWVLGDEAGGAFLANADEKELGAG